MSEDEAAAVTKPRRRWLRWVAGTILGVLALAVAGLALLDSDMGHRWVADRIAALRPSNGLRYSVGRIDGSLFSKATLTIISPPPCHGGMDSKISFRP